MTRRPDGVAGDAVSTLNRLAPVLRWLAPLAGAAVGFGTLAFAAGFLSQRAQYDFAQVPFVFIDYWAYAETGTVALLDSVYLMLSRPIIPIALVLATLALIFSLRSESFRRWTLHAHWPFLAYLATVAVLLIVVNQQLSVRGLRNVGPTANDIQASAVSGCESGSSVPAVRPFCWFLDDGLAVPTIDEVLLPPTSFAMWGRIADQLEEEIGDGARYLQIRPPPAWAVNALSTNGGTSRTSFEYASGVPVAGLLLESERAIELYRLILSVSLVAAWLLGVALFADRRVLLELRNSSIVPEQHLMAVLHSFRKEIWASGHWVLRPIAALLLLVSAVFLLPESYGVLAMPRLGHEYVEVVPRASSAGGRATRGVVAERIDQLGDQIPEAMNVLSDYDPLDRATSEKVRDAWYQIVEGLEATGDVKAAEALELMANASSAVAPELSEIAFDAWVRGAVLEGFILHYPRSDQAALRLLRRNPFSRARRWTISPIAMGDVSEIRVKRDYRALSTIEHLRRMEGLDPQQRAGALRELYKLGHPRLLEIAIAGTLDPSHEIRGYSVTDVGRYGAAVLGQPGSALRTQVATRRLIEILLDDSELGKIRAAAATAAHRCTPTGDRQMCASLAALIDAADSSINDSGWQVRGAAITSAALLGCQQIAPVLLRLIEDSAIPERVRATIPTQLIRASSQAESAPVLARLLRSAALPPLVVGPTLTALSLIPGRDKAVSVGAIVEFLKRSEYGEFEEDVELLSDYRQTAIDSLRQIGDPRAVPSIERFAMFSSETDHSVRGKAVVALGELGGPEAENRLMDVVENSDERESVRIEAIRALRRFHDDRTVRRLSIGFSKETPAVQAAILNTLIARGRAGSGVADAAVQHLREDLPEDYVPGSDGTEPTHWRNSAPIEDHTPSVASLEQQVRELRPGIWMNIDLTTEQDAAFVLEPGFRMSYRLEAETQGSADPVVAVIRVSDEELIGIDDDGGGGRNSVVEALLEPESHLVVIRNIGSEGAIRLRAVPMAREAMRFAPLE